LTKEYAQASETLAGDQFQSEKAKELAQRNGQKFGCYVLDIGHKDMIDEIKMLGLSIEEGVNIAAKKANH